MDDTQSERFLRGVAKISEVGGSAEAIFAAVADIAPDLGRYVAEFAFGDIYGRPGIEPPTRQLLTIAALTALGDSAPQLRVHIRSALHVGVEPAVVVEAILHTLVFAGFPRTVNAIAVARSIFDEQGLLPVSPVDTEQS
ncbi:carboxymuconolactone decarboxylase family protein [Rhodococcus sp. G-MC3]|uniref:carboxymuconolactone decarboxylase family protein n=1 Tax=Rhodococcus sp. G-MC3 TaxID=3046209 RepID=UPI0024B90596|nr:carboxymuconolactone decarboxylase family protein [Rhodococcus sp. G-MC3]MDJ0396709.1 carboxymuconolactone decarboxylase family protein [Rhodococcus sp. G-MC3]